MNTWLLWAMKTRSVSSRKPPTRTSAAWSASTVVSCGPISAWTLALLAIWGHPSRRVVSYPRERDARVPFLPAILSANTTVRAQICVFVYNPFPYSLFGLTALEQIMGCFLMLGISVCQHQCWGDSSSFSTVTQRMPIMLLFQYPSCTNLLLMMW